MSSRWTSLPATLLLMLLLITAPLPSLAQAELESFVKRYDELFQAGNYDAALAEARKFESAARTPPLRMRLQMLFGVVGMSMWLMP